MKLTNLLQPAIGWTNAHTRCALRTCVNTALMRSIHSRGGIRVGQLSYCSVDCLVMAARSQFARLTGDNVFEARHQPRLSLGLVMLAKGDLTDAQLRQATEQSHVRGEDFEVSLGRMGLANERRIAAARAAQWGCATLGPDHVSQRVESDIPRTLLERCSAVPVHYSPVAKRFMLGFVHRVEHSLLASINQITGSRAEPCFITATGYAEQMRRITAVTNYEELVIEEIHTASQMARMMGGLAAELAVKEAGFARCRDYVWTRLKGKRGMMDVLFRVHSGIPTEDGMHSGFLS